MIEPSDLLDFALDLRDISGRLIDPLLSEAAARRAVSACYYSLFHTVAEAGASLFSGDAGQRQKIARSYEHGAITKAAKRLENASRKSGRLAPVDDRLEKFGQTMIELRQRREAADYDLSASFTADDAFENWSAAAAALRDFDCVRSDPDTVAFLLDALLGERRGRG